MCLICSSYYRWQCLLAKFQLVQSPRLAWRDKFSQFWELLRCHLKLDRSDGDLRKSIVPQILRRHRSITPSNHPNLITYIMVMMMTMMMMAVMMIGTFIELYGHSEWLWWLKTFPFLVSTTSSFSSLCFIWWSRLLSCPTLTVMIITFIINIIITTSPLISSAKLGLVSEPSTFTMMIW